MELNLLHFTNSYLLCNIDKMFSAFIKSVWYMALHKTAHYVIQCMNGVGLFNTLHPLVMDPAKNNRYIPMAMIDQYQKLEDSRFRCSQVIMQTKSGGKRQSKL